MKYLLIYYTGTYNTRFLTDCLQDQLVARGHEVSRVEITCDTEPVNTEGFDIIGYSYPIYGFNSPLPFNKYVSKLKFTAGQKFFIYKNSGETLAMNNASSRILIRRMKRKKLVFCGEYHFVLPYNIHFPYADNFVRQILYEDAKLMQIMLHDLENGIVKEIKSKKLYNFAAFFVGIQKIAGNINSFFYKVDMNKCVKCMKCVNNCPHNNIYVNKKGKIKFHHHCDMCMRCSFFCPTDAFKIGFLDSWGWKVNGDYKLKKVAKDDSPYEPYITEKSEGFYKCFIKTFAEIDAEYERLFGDKPATLVMDSIAKSPALQEVAATMVSETEIEETTIEKTDE